MRIASSANAVTTEPIVARNERQASTWHHRDVEPSSELLRRYASRSSTFLPSEAHGTCGCSALSHEGRASRVERVRVAARRELLSRDLDGDSGRPADLRAHRGGGRLFADRLAAESRVDGRRTTPTPCERTSIDGGPVIPAPPIRSLHRKCWLRDPGRSRGRCPGRWRGCRSRPHRFRCGRASRRPRTRCRLARRCCRCR